MKGIQELIKRVEVEINKTPTGELRNLLCDANIVLQQADVIRQNEQLVCEHDWQSIFHNDNLIGRYCPECKELRAD